MYTEAFRNHRYYISMLECTQRPLVGPNYAGMYTEAFSRAYGVRMSVCHICVTIVTMCCICVSYLHSVMHLC